ncbi:DNA primase [Ekhidna lutea]|uniref:DNA primase n=1 Tax=Ekhidna lutea TaxID=447679 RepID=A0A239HY98_EKHLU|nr:DNA primase [Ekhidna lutea]SNS86456.1 DNA primase [Ekhidna lutea]
MIHPSTIEEIKNRIDIVEVVGDFVTLKRSGSSYKAHSPFTNEKTPSFYVVPSKGIFKDFSSGKGGDAISFVMEVDGLSYVEALKYLAGKYGIEIKEEEQSDEAQQAQNKRESLYIVLNFANEYFQKVLHNTDEGKSIGLSYFKERGFTEETIKKFELGYSRELWDGLLNEATQKGYNKEILSEAGLVIDKDGKNYDRFRSRVMFPIHNVSGKTIAFGGRKLSSTDKSAKYINSPETELYHKSKVLYGMYQGKNAIRKEDNCYLVEGYTDVISMHQAGVENVVASSGTALTEDQVKLIRRYTENVTVIFDGDQAGIKASMRGIDLLLEGDLNVKAVALPEGEDPDSYAKQLGASGFREYVGEEAQDIIRFKTKVLLDETGNDPVKKAGVIKDIVSSITKINDPVKRTVYIKDCSDLLGIAESVLVAEQNKILIENRKKQRSDQSSQPEIEAPPFPMEQEEIIDQLDIAKIIEYQERESIRVLVNYGKNKIQTREMQDQNLIDYFLNEADEIQFTNETYRKIIEVFREKLNEGEVIDGEFLLHHEDEKVRKTVIDLSADKYEISENWSEKYQIHVPRETEFLRDVTYTNVLRLKFRIVQQLIQEETDKLKHATSEAEVDELLDDINELKMVSVEIAKILGNVLVG